MTKKLDEARKILSALGMPAPQTNDNAAYTLLAFTGVHPRTPWGDAEDRRLNPHGVLEFIARAYNKHYAENTRETIRRQAIHHFVIGGILIRNPDNPELATNSPRTHYALSKSALDVIRLFNTSEFAPRAAAFLLEVGGGLTEKHARPRNRARVPVALPDGQALFLSPGEHNRLQREVIEEFLPNFVHRPRVLYLGDTDNKMLICDTATFHALGIPISRHDKLPDIVVLDQERNWLFLIEAVTSHGPVSTKRQLELEAMVEKSAAGAVYVSAFLDFATFSRRAGEIAWDTEVWVAAFPDHMLHYNGDRFIGPRQ